MARSREIWILAAVWLWLGRPVSADLQVFASFEDAAEVEAVRPGPGVRVAPSTRFPAWASHSLEVKVSEPGGEVRMTRLPGNWGRQESLLVFVWSTVDSSLGLVLQDGAGVVHRWSFPLRSGVNHLQCRLREATSLDLRRVESLHLEFGGAGIFYLDYFALDRFHPVLEERGRWDAAYSMEIETPHVPWGRPLAGGPLRVYALAGVRDGRGIIELAQRLQLDFRVTTQGRSPGINKWGFGDFYEHRSPGGEFWDSAYSLVHAYLAHDLLYGPDADVILWPGLHPWESYPREVRDAIRRRVEAGTGLVLFFPFSREGPSGELWSLSPLVEVAPRPSRREGETGIDRSRWLSRQDHFITRGVSLDSFPWEQLGVVPSRVSGQLLLETEKGTPVLAVRTVGRGRVVAFGYLEQGMIPEISNLWKTGLEYPYHEYLWSLVARAVVWAGRREAHGQIRRVESSREGVQVHTTGAPPGSRLWFRMEDDFGEEEGSGEVEISDRQAQVPLPASLHGGRHGVQLRLLVNGQVLDWASLELHTEQPVRVEGIRCRSEQVSLGAPVEATVHLSSTTDSPSTLKVRLLDNYGRLLAETRTPLTVQSEGSWQVRLDSSGALTHLAWVEAEVEVKGRRSDRRRQEVFLLRPRQWDDYDLTMYRFGPDPFPGIWPAIDAQLRRLNVTTLAAYSLDHSRYANYQIQAQTRISGQESPDGPLRDYYTGMKKKYLETRDKRVLVREFCLNDPAYRAQVRQELEEMIPRWAPFSPQSYYVYEEPSLTCYGDALDLCFSSHCLARMREWLKGEYGSLEALNRQWGTGFTRWEEVVPDDTYEARRRGNSASWADHRSFMEWSYADAFRFVLEELRKLDPGGILLNSGTQISGSHNGCDYSQINRYTEHLNAYTGGNQLDFHRCFNPALKISGGAGYGALGKEVLYDFYGNLFKGASAGAYIFWQYSTLNPDLSLCQSGRDMEEGFRELREGGIGKLVGLGTPDHHGIAIHYSYPSIHGAWIVDGEILERVSYQSSRTFTRFGQNRDGWVKILRDAGFQFDFLSYRDLEKGGLTGGPYRVFVLPMSVALSDEEVEAIRRFVRQGGILLADALPGVMDEHTTFRKRRPLEEVFGVRLAGADPDTVAAMEGEPRLVLEGARPLLEEGGKPRLLHHRYGEGQAFLLNYFLHHYPEARQEKRHQEDLKRLQRVLQAGGLVPRVQLTSLSGQVADGISLYWFNNGPTRLLGLLPDLERAPKETLRIEFLQEQAIYDVRRKDYLGFRRTLEQEVEAGVPELYALVAGPVQGLEVTAPSSLQRGQEIVVSYRVSGPPRFRSVVRVELLGPDGRLLGLYGGNFDLVEGRGEFRLRPALNDPAGRWRIRVTDVISGLSAQSEIFLR